MGTVSIDVIADDGNGGTVTDTFNIVVANTNDAPTTTPVTLASIVENSGPRLITQAELLANATDVDGDTLTATNLAISGGAGALVDNGDGTWTYTPALNDSTAVAFTYTITDGSAPVVASATLDITPSVNSNPVANDDIAATVEDTALVIPVGTLLANDTDVDGDTLTVLSVQGAVNGTVSLAAGNVTFTPTANYFGPASFTYTVSDGNGGTATATVNVTVTAVNDAPTTTPVALAPVAEDSGARLITQAELLANASDVEGGPLTATGLAINAGLGTLVDNGNGTWTYTPAPNNDTAVNFTYTISDGATAVAGSASLDLTPVNDAPVNSVPGPQAALEDTALAIIGLSVGDPDGGAITVTLGVANGTLTVNLTGGAAIAGGANGSATLTLSGTVAQVNATLATLTYLSGQNWNGADTFTVTSSDPGGLGDTETFAIAVAPVNDAPALVDNAFAIANGGTLALTSANLSATDVDDAVAGLMFTVAGVTHGQFELVGFPSVAIASFSQAQIIGGQVQFVHDGSGVAPVFTLAVSDAAATTGPYLGGVLFNAGGGAAASDGTTAVDSLPGTTDLPLTRHDFAVTAAPLSISPDMLPHPVLPLVNAVAQTYLRAPAGPAVSTNQEETGAPEATTSGTPTERPAGPLQPSAGDDARAETAVNATTALAPIDAQPDALGQSTADSTAGLEPLRAETESIAVRQAPVNFETQRQRHLLGDVLRIGGVVASLGAVAWVAHATGLLRRVLGMPPAWRGAVVPPLRRDEEEQQSATSDAVAKRARRTRARKRLVGRHQRQ